MWHKWIQYSNQPSWILDPCIFLTYRIPPSKTVHRERTHYLHAHKVAYQENIQYFSLSKHWTDVISLEKSLNVPECACMPPHDTWQIRGLVMFYCPAAPLLCWYFVSIQTQEYDLVSPKPARLPSNALINQRLLRQPLYNPAIQEVKLPENYSILTHKLRNSANVHNSTAFFSVMQEKKRSITTIKLIGRKCWTKLKRLKKRRRGELGNRWKGKKKFRSFITHQMMNPECTLRSWHRLSTHCLAKHSSVLPLAQSPSPPFTDKPFSGENATLMGSD